jgi:hypothetical protein
LEAAESHARCREELRIQSDSKPALLGDLLETFSGNKEEHLLRFDLSADRLQAEALFLQSLDLGARDGIGRLGVGEDASKPEPHSFRVFALAILPGADGSTGAYSLRPLVERLTHVSSTSSSSSRTRYGNIKILDSEGGSPPKERQRTKNQ